MKKRRIIPLTLLVSAFLGTPLALADSHAGAAAAYEKALAAAKAARQLTSAANGEWRDIGDFLNDAEEAAKKGDYRTAIQLAKKAQDQSELGTKQAASQKDAGFSGYLGK